MAAGSMTVDELLNSMPKMLRIADDMHNMTSYINDLRILTIVLTVAGFLGGIGFVLFKLCGCAGPNQQQRYGSGSRRNSFDRPGGDRPGRNHHGGRYYDDQRLIERWGEHPGNPHHPGAMIDGGSSHHQPTKVVVSSGKGSPTDSTPLTTTKNSEKSTPPPPPDSSSNTTANHQIVYPNLTKGPQDIV